MFMANANREDVRPILLNRAALSCILWASKAVEYRLRGCLQQRHINITARPLSYA